MKIEFMRPTLKGARFAEHAVPLEVLRDLAVLEEMIIEIAKAEFFSDHPDRQRAPRGFTEGIELKLTGIEEGSAIPVISLFVAATAIFPPDNQAYFERARESLVNAVAAAESNQLITQHLPERTLSYFDRLGRSLRDGEAIEFTSPGHPQPASLTKETRRRLLLASSAVTELTDEILIRGSVPEADQQEMTFQLQLADGHRVDAPISAQLLDGVLEAFNGYKSGSRVLLKGVGRFNRQQRLLGLDSVEHMTLLDPLDVRARLDELRALKAGWLDGEGEPLPAEGLMWLADAFDQLYPEDLQSPFLYPTPESGIQAEWSEGSKDATLAIDLKSHVAHWHELDVERDSEESRDLDLNNGDHWAWLADKIRRISGANR
jgi:hypothetical protein